MKKILIGLIFVLIIILASVGGYRLYHYLRYDRYPFYWPDQIMADYAFVNDKQALFVSWENKDKDAKEYQDTIVHMKSYSGILSGKRYLSTEGIKLKQDSGNLSFKRTRLEDGEYWNITVYDLESPKLKTKTYDLFKAVRAYNEERIPIFYSHNGVYFYEGREYRSFRLKYKEDPNKVEDVLLDLETGQIREMPQGTEATYTTSSIPYAGTNLKTYLDSYFTLNSRGLRTFSPEDSIFREMSERWQLAKQYPKAYKLVTTKTTAWYLLTDKSEDVPLVAKTYGLFLSEGGSIFNNLTINEKYSVDGEPHTVNSYEEFMKYYKVD